MRRVDPDDRKRLDDLVAAQQQLRREMERLDSCLVELTNRLNTGAATASEEQICVSMPALPTCESTTPPLSLNVTETDGSHPAAPQPASPPPPTTSKGDALELQLGTVWLVRLSVVILLTGLVFLGNYAYHNFIGKLGPAGRLALLYVAGGGLCAIGAWIERGRESLRNYSRVLMGGGVAAVYYATYAAYFVSRLQVIHSPVLAGALLLALAIAIAGLADRKRSETLASCAILLSFYTGTVNPIAEFTLFSNLLLTAMAVLFMARRQWTALSSLSLAAAYVSFGFWRYFHTGCLPWMFAQEGRFWPGILVLTGYWGLFTTGLFLCEKFPPGRRLAFLSANNGAYFALATTLIRGAWPLDYWMFPCGLGAACMALAWPAQRRLRDDPLVDGAYLAQGLILLTLGLVIKLTGYQLALMLALEGAVLLTCCRQRHAWFYKAGAMTVSVTAFLVGVFRITEHSWLALPLGGVLALLFLYDARWSKQLDESNSPGKPDDEFRPFVAVFVAMALVCGGLVIHFGVAPEWRFPLLAVVTVFCLHSIRLHGMLELAILAQGYLWWAGDSWMSHALNSPPVLPWWNPAMLVAATLSVVHWWHGQPPSRQRLGFLGQAVGSLGMVVLLYHWLGEAVAPGRLLVALPVVAMLLLGYGVFTRTLALRLASQLFVILCAIAFFRTYIEDRPPSAAVAAIAFTAILLNGMVVQWTFENSIWPDGSPALEPGGVPLLEGYRFLALAMYITWAWEYVPDRWHFAFFVFSALGLFAAGLWSHRPWRVLRCATLLLLALWVFWFEDSNQVSWPNTIAVVVLLWAFHAVKRPALNWRGLHAPWRDFIAYAILATLWQLVTRWVRIGGHDFYTTVAWSLLAAAVLGSGFLFHERSHRRAGMLLLALAVGRILLIDVWALETGYRIASFLVLGLVLSLLGFLYNRYADRVRNLQ